MRSTVGRALRLGQLLLEAKALLPHGTFQAWCEAKTPWSRRRCRFFMHLAETAEFDRFDPSLSLNAALKALAAPPALTPAREPPAAPLTCTVENLHQLIAHGLRFGTIYADPPWAYDNPPL